ncbi:PTS fructose transporter subunit IIABC [Mycoplasmoides pirum]|nr:fructose-specific PTS transporter subunit EIIC [Mycoplasmoides pirum]
MINFTNRCIEFNIDAGSKNDALKKIASIAHQLEITNNLDELYEAFIRREKESSTGFEKGFAVPHARDNCVKKSSLMYVRFKNPIDWEALDGQKTQHCFVIMIPKDEQNNEHIDMLSKISVALMNEKFINEISTTNSTEEAYKIISDYMNINSNNQNNNETIVQSKEHNNTRNILAITACPVGVAHTYLAAEKLMAAAKENGWNIKVETHGSSGIKNHFTDDEIKNADLIIIAADIGIDTDRFYNKKVYKSAIKPAIHKPVELINEAYENATLITNSTSNNQNQTKSFGSKKQKENLMKHILSGISYMIPFVMLGGVCIALSIGIGKLIYGQNADISQIQGDFLYYLNHVGSIAFTLMIGVLGAYIANSIAGRSAIAPAFIVSVLGNTASAIFSFGGIQVQTAMGFIGSLLFGISIGYTVKWMNTWNVPKSISPIMPIFVIPLGVGIFYSLIAIFVIGAPIAWIMGQFINALESVFKQQDGAVNAVSLGVSIGIGFVIGAMAGFDMGGPINKVAFLTCTTLITSQIYEPMGMIAAAIPVAPLGMGLCTLIFRHKFDEQEKSLGVSAIIMGFIGISEGAIPFAVSDPKKAIPCNVIGSAIAGAIAAAFSVTCAAGHGGPIVAILGAIGSGNDVYGIAGGIGFFFLAIVIGTAITCTLYGLIRNREISSLFKKSKDKNQQTNENFNNQVSMNNIVYPETNLVKNQYFKRHHYEKIKTIKNF